MTKALKRFVKSSQGISAIISSDFHFIFKHYSIDTDGSGKIDYTEFLAATMEKSIYMKEDKLHQAFKMLDQDGNGKISREELKNVLGSKYNLVFCFYLKQKIFLKEELGHEYTESYWDNMIKEVDKNGDGEVNLTILI